MKNALNKAVQGVIKTGVSMDFRAFFHPDCYGRYRNCTGSCAEALADSDKIWLASPPVGNCTLP